MMFRDRENQFGPGKLWSLWDIMQRFRAASVSNAMSSLLRAVGFIEGANFGGADPDIKGDRSILSSELDSFSGSFEDIPVSRAVKDQFRRLQVALNTAESRDLIIMIREFYNNFIVELSGHYFLLISDDKRELYEQKTYGFGDIIALKFPDASKDVAAACRCFALDEWTACVFHSMRVLEHGLRSMASQVGLGVEAITHENWKNVIDQIEKRIRDIEKEPKSSEKIERLRALSVSAAEFRYFKDAWRNHVAHANAHYDERDAQAVFQHVRSFMNQMADVVSE